MSFENILNRLVSNDKVKFMVLSGDITTHSLPQNISKKIAKKVTAFLNEPKNKYLNLQDIIKIVQIVDLDAAFINPEQIIKSDNNIKEYKENTFNVPNVEDIIKRNSVKKSVIEKLSKINYISIESSAIPYEIYYFSCNLEHVLHGDPNVSSDIDKTRLSDEFAAKFLGYENLFIDFIDDDEFATKLDYRLSWIDAMKPQNALKRSTNFNLFFK